MKIYTGTGDSGETALFSGPRVPKDHPRIEACGAIDELNSFLGLAMSQVCSERSRAHLSLIQHDLFAIGSHMASPEQHDDRKGPGLPQLPRSRPAEMEAWIDEAEKELSPLRAFILPGGSAAACALHLCRTVCRRAERSAVRVGAEDPGASFAIIFLNRLSDLLFMLARIENLRAGVKDIEWEQKRQ